ncbi:MAG: DUF349 domain-containing protein, partial [Arenibacter sp.]
MLEDKDDNLQHNVGTEETSGNTEAINNSEAKNETKSAPNPETIETDSVNNSEELAEDKSASIDSDTKNEEKLKESSTQKAPEKVSIEKSATSEDVLEDVVNNETSAETTEEKEEDVLEEIDESNAEDAEDSDNHQRHHIPMPDYHAMSMENLVGELQRLVRNEKVQAIKKHVDGIKYEFDQKFQEFIDEKKEDFINSGGNEIDFRYNSVDKRQFNEVYSDYREKRNSYYKNLEQGLKSNLAQRLEIINELKALVNVEEDINTTYKNFKDLQERWKNAGPIPRANYNDVWRTYHHHIEIFYDFLHLNRELRDLDFKHNYEEKLKIVVRAEELVQIEDLNKAFQELQTLHKIWKEDIGPVGKEHREEIWDRFSNATKLL